LRFCARKQDLLLHLKRKRGGLQVGSRGWKLEEREREGREGGWGEEGLKNEGGKTVQYFIWL